MLEKMAAMPFPQQIAVSAFLLMCILAALAWAATVIYSIRIPFHAKTPGLRGWFRLNPLNLVFFSDRLTPKGLILRRRLLISAGCFFACIGLGALFGLIAKAFAQS